MAGSVYLASAAGNGALSSGVSSETSWTTLATHRCVCAAPLCCRISLFSYDMRSRSGTPSVDVIFYAKKMTGEKLKSKDRKNCAFNINGIVLYVAVAVCRAPFCRRGSLARTSAATSDTMLRGVYAL